MGNPRGVKRDFEALEQRRLLAIKLFGEGLNNSEIGRELKVANQTVSRWRGQHRAGGTAALAKAGRAGRKALLTGEQLSQLVESLKRGPEAHGYDAPLWTCDRVGRNRCRNNSWLECFKLWERWHLPRAIRKLCCPLTTSWFWTASNAKPIDFD